LTALDRVDPGEVIWYHDVVAFQLQPLPKPSQEALLSFCLYSTRERMLVQGGSLFFNRDSRPVFENVLDRLKNHRCRKDEFALTDITGLPEYKDRFRVLDYSYNLGSTDFELRYQLAEKPIKVVHFHLGMAEHRAVFLHGRNTLDARPVDSRFLDLLDETGFDLSEDPSQAHASGDPEGRYHSTNPLVHQVCRVFSWAG
jgi:hypothetical protein